MKDKIKVLLAFINNEELNIDSIEEINLSMEDDGLIIWQERLKTFLTVKRRRPDENQPQQKE